MPPVPVVVIQDLPPAQAETAAVVAPAGPVAPPAGCYDGSSGFDLNYNGNTNTVGNGAWHPFFDGSCGGAPQSPRTFVFAVDNTEAQTECQNLGTPGVNFATDEATRGWTGLDNLWLCQP